MSTTTTLLTSSWGQPWVRPSWQGQRRPSWQGQGLPSSPPSSQAPSCRPSWARRTIPSWPGRAWQPPESSHRRRRGWPRPVINKGWDGKVRRSCSSKWATILSCFGSELADGPSSPASPFLVQLVPASRRKCGSPNPGVSSRQVKNFRHARGEG